LTSAQPTVKQARKSAWAVGGVLVAIAAWNVYRGRPNIYWSFGSIGSLLLIIGSTWAGGAMAFHRGWMKFAMALGAINSRIILALIFYLVITPYGLIMRLFGRDVLHRRGSKSETYWIPRSATRQPTRRFERLF
jgi:hypothetical protein